MDSRFERFAAEAAGQRATNFAYGHGCESVPQRLAPDVLEFARSPQSAWRAGGRGGNIRDQPGGLWGVLAREAALDLGAGEPGLGRAKREIACNGPMWSSARGTAQEPLEA